LFWPQTLSTPVPPQVSWPEQVPQLAVRGFSQLSTLETSSQSFPRRAQNAGSVSGMQPQRLSAPQVSGAVQVPHSSVPSQPSSMLPQSAFRSLHVILVRQVVGAPAPPAPPVPPAPPGLPAPPVLPGAVVDVLSLQARRKSARIVWSGKEDMLAP
jgi:hypothetical protein